MSLLTDTSPLKVPGKRSYEHGSHYSLQFSPNFKRPKADAIRQFPKHCGGLACRTNRRENGGFTSGLSSKTPTVTGEVVAIASEPLRTLAPVNLTSESAMPGKVDFVEQKVMVNNADKNESETPRKFDSEIMEANNVQPEAMVDMGTLKVSSNPPALSRKFSKSRQGVAVLRQFPPNCGRQNHVSISKAGVLADEIPGIEPNPPKEMLKVCDKSVRDENSGSSGIGQKIDKDVIGGRIDKYQNEPDYVISYVIGSGKGELVQRKTSTECKVEQEEDEEEVRLVSSSEWNSLQSNSECQKVCKEDANCGHEGHKAELMDVGKSNSELMSEDNESSVSEDNSTMDDSSLPAVVDNNEELEDLMKAKELDDLRIMTYEECLAVDYCDKVREALKLFEELYVELLQKHKANPKGPAKNKCHIPVEAARILRKQQIWINKVQEFGHVPGVKIGDSFRFRAELAVVGLHHQYMSGIDYVKIGIEEYATSIVDSGRYENETRSDDILIYLGQGGNPKLSDRKPVDQKLEGPNQALMNSMHEGRPVRVIRGRESANKKSRKYVYDGLYTVMNCLQEREQSGKFVFKFELHRIPGQPKLVYVSGLKAKDNCVVSDVSQGKEKVPIRAVNAVNNEKPPPFTYIAKMVYPDWYHPPIPTGCNCVNGCSDPEICSCAARNGGEIPFNGRGSIIRAKPIVYECGPSCKCPPSCMNRVSQHGPSYSLEIFMTESRGWGVRSRNYISSGSFICEYIGELLKDEEAELRINHDDYLFDIGNHFEDLIQRESRGILDTQSDYQKSIDDDTLAIREAYNTQPNSLEASEGEGFAIDAQKVGNIGKFINHSCSPNLYAQNVLYDHEDKRALHVMLFAAKNIRPLTELTYDYNYKMDRVSDENGNIKKKDCYCGSRECTGRMY